MVKRLTIFHKVILLIVFLLIPIVGLYVYSNQVSVGVVQNEIKESIGRQLAFAQNRLNLQLDHLTKSAAQLGGDPIVKSFETIEGFESYFDVIDSKKKTEERISIQNNLSDWPSQSAIYFPFKQEAISPTSLVQYDADYLAANVSSEWKSRQTVTNGVANYQFYYYAIRSYSGYADPLKANAIVEMKFDDDNVIRLLDDYKSTGQGDPFLFNPEQGVIVNRSPNRELIDQVARLLSERTLAPSGAIPAELSGRTYLVNYVQTHLRGWTIVDYVPMHAVLSPIVSSNQLFYASMSLLVLLSVIASYMLYRHVQIPIKTLVKSLRLVQHGDFATRIRTVGNNEFSFVFQRFNDMTDQIQRLIENVYTEQLRSRDAQLKQLQSQINPHFLYNCLYFIVNMARLERLEPIERMALNLGSFFKYTTRLEKPDTTIADELQLIGSYLEIQQLRLNRIEYDIDVPDEIMGLEIPRLLLQPIVENAVIHGIEPKPGGGSIRITGGIDNGRVWLEVRDNGIGMSGERQLDIAQRLRQPMTEGTGYGVWNVNQRLALRFGEDSGVRYSAAPGGGLVVRLEWRDGSPEDRKPKEGGG